jgi:hypothetical protein
MYVGSAPVHDTSPEDKIKFWVLLQNPLYVRGAPQLEHEDNYASQGMRNSQQHLPPSN